jgi:hypothetical protein
MSDNQEIHERIPDALVRRLERLEQKYRRLRGTNRLLVVGLAVLLGTAAATVVTLALRLPRLSGDVVQARSFALRDAKGRLRGVFGMATDGASQLVLQDEMGHARLRLVVLGDGSPGFTLIDQKGRSRAALGLLPDETITLAFADRQGISRVALGLTARQAASLALADSDGITRAGMGVAADGKSTVTTLNGPGGSTTVVPQ